MNQWDFLKAPRFWALVLGSISLALYQDHIISQSIMVAITSITGGFVSIRTIDRFSEKVNSKEQTINNEEV